MFAKVTGQLQSNAKEIIGIPNNVEATSIRAGGIQEMAGHQDVTTFDSSCRSGHLNMMAAACRTYEYTHATASAVLIGGMAASGYVHCRVKVCTARLIFFNGMSAQDQMGMTNLLEKLLSSDIDFGEAKRNLYFCMFATFLMHLETFVSTYSTKHFVVMRTLTVAKEFGFSYVQLLAYGADVRADFYARNSAYQASASSNSQVNYYLYIYIYISINIYIFYIYI